MTINTDNIASTVIKWACLAVQAAILIALIAMLMKMFGISIPVRTPSVVDLAYMAGVYWLVK